MAVLALASAAYPEEVGTRSCSETLLSGSQTADSASLCIERSSQYHRNRIEQLRLSASDYASQKFSYLLPKRIAPALDCIHDQDKASDY